MALEIRLLRAGEESVLANVAGDVFDHAVDRAAAKSYLADPRLHLAVAIDAGIVVGFASGVHYHHPDKPAPELFVNEVGVAPTHHRRGIASAVIGALFEAARELGCTEAWVLTERTNAAAMSLYASIGGMTEPEDPVMFSFDLGDERTQNDEPRTANPDRRTEPRTRTGNSEPGTWNR